MNKETNKRNSELKNCEKNSCFLIQFKLTKEYITIQVTSVNLLKLMRKKSEC